MKKSDGKTMTLQRIMLGLLACVVATPIFSDPGATRYLAKNKVLCDSERIACMRGTVTYDEGTRTLTVRGRIVSSEKTGTLQLVFQATDTDGSTLTRYIDVPVTRHTRRIVDRELITGESYSVTDWYVRCILFMAYGEEDVPRVLPPVPE